MTYYRKKPVVIEAWQFTLDPRPGAVAWHPMWITDAMMDGAVWWQGAPEPYFTIRTLEGEMRANVGDWIIRGIKGELYPCRDDIFRATYDPVTDGSVT